MTTGISTPSQPSVIFHWVVGVIVQDDPGSSRILTANKSQSNGKITQRCISIAKDPPILFVVRV
jgi:hypothetical protein